MIRVSGVRVPPPASQHWIQPAAPDIGRRETSLLDQQREPSPPTQSSLTENTKDALSVPGLPHSIVVPFCRYHTALFAHRFFPELFEAASGCAPPVQRLSPFVPV